MDRNKIIADLVAKVGVKIDADDPAFLLVELNALVFAELIEPAISRLDANLAELKKIRALPAMMTEQSDRIEEQISRINASKEYLIAEIARRAQIAAGPGADNPAAARPQWIGYLAVALLSAACTAAVTLLI
jgi:hypothetical protein